MSAREDKTAGQRWVVGSSQPEAGQPLADIKLSRIFPKECLWRCFFLIKQKEKKETAKYNLDYISIKNVKSSNFTKTIELKGLFNDDILNKML